MRSITYDVYTRLRIIRLRIALQSSPPALVAIMLRIHYALASAILLPLLPFNALRYGNLNDKAASYSMPKPFE